MRYADGDGTNEDTAGTVTWGLGLRALSISLMTAGALVWLVQGFDASLGHGLALTGAVLAFLPDGLKQVRRAFRQSKR
jgi:hypothetical protein